MRFFSGTRSFEKGAAKFVKKQAEKFQFFGHPLTHDQWVSAPDRNLCATLTNAVTDRDSALFRGSSQAYFDTNERKVLDKKWIILDNDRFFGKFRHQFDFAEPRRSIGEKNHAFNCFLEIEYSDRKINAVRKRVDISHDVLGTMNLELNFLGDLAKPQYIQRPPIFGAQQEIPLKTREFVDDIENVRNLMGLAGNHAAQKRQTFVTLLGWKSISQQLFLSL
jgi:hypothetical protein